MTCFLLVDCSKNLQEIEALSEEKATNIKKPELRGILKSTQTVKDIKIKRYIKKIKDTP